MRILIAESKWTGHHLFFAAGIAEALADGDHEITLAVTNSGEENARRMVDLAVAGLPRNISIRTSLPGPPLGFARIGDRDGAIERTTIEREVAEIDPDVVVIPSGDALAFHLGGGGRRSSLNAPEIRMVLHQPYVGYGDRGWRFAAKRELIRRRLRRFRPGLAAIDHRIARSLGPRRGVTLIPDPPAPSEPTSRAEARLRFDVPAEHRVFLAAGEHSTRKGTDRLLACWPQVGNDRTTLLVVGRCTDAVRRAVARRSDDVDARRIVLLDRIVDVQTHLDAFRAADVVTACYPQHFGASGILNTAVAMGRPMIGSDYGCIGETIRAFGLGAALDCRDPKRMSAALTRLVASPPTLDPVRSGPLARFHTIENRRRVLRSWILDETSTESPPIPFPPFPEAADGSVPGTNP